MAAEAGRGGGGKACVGASLAGLASEMVTQGGDRLGSGRVEQPTALPFPSVARPHVPEVS